MLQKFIMVVGGTGAVGRWITNMLARTPGLDRLVVAARKEDVGAGVVDSATISSMLNGLSTKVEFQKMDLEDPQETAKTLQQLSPPVIINATTVISSYDYAPIVERRLTELGIKTRLAGHTFAKDFLPIYRLMKAVKASGIETKVVNVSFPDHTNAALGKIGLAPASGAGTIDMTVEGIRKVAAKKLNAPIENVSVTMVAHHSIRTYYGLGTPVPYFLRIRLKGEDYTQKLKPDELIEKGVRMTAGPEYKNAPQTASSAVKTALAILNDSGISSHAPGVKGLPGGYPVRITAEGPEIKLPSEVSMKEAQRINQEGMKYDGVERFEDDGTVIFTKETVDFMKRFLKMNWERVSVADAEKMANELVSAYRALGAPI